MIFLNLECTNLLLPTDYPKEFDEVLTGSQKHTNRQKLSIRSHDFRPNSKKYLSAIFM